MNSKILYVVAALVVLAIHGSISVKLRSGARTAPTNAEWAGLEVISLALPSMPPMYLSIMIR